MCLLEPFKPPCCGRTYVKTSKVPSCPDAWPKAKCPPELCIQITLVYAAEGTCWRCKADQTGKHGWEREAMRPGIDKAYIVHGLEEIGVSGRRARVEAGDHCWFCNAKGGCEACGAEQIMARSMDQQQHHGSITLNIKRKKNFPEISGHPVKKAKAEHLFQQSASTLHSGTRHATSTYLKARGPSNGSQKYPATSSAPNPRHLVPKHDLSQYEKSTNPRNYWQRQDDGDTLLQREHISSKSTHFNPLGTLPQDSFPNAIWQPDNTELPLFEGNDSTYFYVLPPGQQQHDDPQLPLSGRHSGLFEADQNLLLERPSFDIGSEIIGSKMQTETSFQLSPEQYVDPAGQDAIDPPLLLNSWSPSLGHQVDMFNVSLLSLPTRWYLSLSGTSFTLISTTK
jgi:hypothetical protein